MAALRNTDFLVPGAASERGEKAGIERILRRWKILTVEIAPHFSRGIGEFVLFLWTAGVVAISLLITVGFIQGVTP